MSLVEERSLGQNLKDILTGVSRDVNGNPIEASGTLGVGGLIQALSKGGLSTSPGEPSRTLSPAIVGNVPQAPAPPFRGQGPAIPQMPNMTASSQSGPRNMPIPAQGGQVEFQTRAGKNAAIVNNAINSIGQFVGQQKQQAWQKKASQAEQAWGSYIGLQQAMQDAQDPKTKQAIQQQLQQLMQDPKIGKIFEKAHADPTSPEGVGLQRAMQMSKQDAMQKAQLEEMRNKAMAEMARAQQEQAHAGLYQRQTDLEGQVTPAMQFNRETELMKFQQQMQQRGYSLEVRGLSPAVKGPDGSVWTSMDLNDPGRAKMMPPEAKAMLLAEYQSKKAEVDITFQRQANQFQQQMKMWSMNMDKMAVSPLVKGYGEDVRGAMNDNMRLARMYRNAELAKRGDQQAMIALLSDHVNMTLRQPGSGAMRINMAQWKEAESSAPLLQRIAARFDDRGALTGVVLSPEQVDQMVQLGETQREVDWIKAKKSADAIEGIGGQQKIRMPDPNMPGLKPLTINFEDAKPSTGTKSESKSQSKDQPKIIVME